MNGALAVVSRSVAAAADWVRHARCRLSGHVLMLHFEPHRLALHCVSCGHTTPGWSLQDRPRR